MSDSFSWLTDADNVLITSDKRDAAPTVTETDKSCGALRSPDSITHNVKYSSSYRKLNSCYENISLTLNLVFDEMRSVPFVNCNNTWRTGINGSMATTL